MELWWAWNELMHVQHLSWGLENSMCAKSLATLIIIIIIISQPSPRVNV